MRKRHLILIAVALAACSDTTDPAAFCRRYADVVALDAESFAIDSAATDEVVAELARAVERYDALADVAPGEVRDDVRELAAYAGRLVEAITAVEADDPFARAAAVAEAVGDEERLTEAADAVTTYERTNC